MTSVRVLLLCVVLAGCATTIEDKYQSELAAYKAGDYRTAELGWKARAERGDADAYALLGYLYYEKMGYPKQGVEMMQAIAKRGNPLARNLLLKAGQPVPAAEQRTTSNDGVGAVFCNSQNYGAFGTQTTCFPVE